MNQNATFKLLGLLIALVAFPFLGFGQGITTSSMNGVVVDNEGQALVGATVVAVHTPSGSKYGATTNDEGIFRMANMRVGGPYTVTINYIGFSDFEKKGVFLTLGQTFRLKANLSSESVTTDEVIITSSRSDIFDGNRTGMETVIGEEAINTLPTISRSIADFARVNPLVNVSEATDGFSFSIGGQNNRYNAIYIDGSINNDQFGLAASGTDGGQTGAGPISVDAIEQIQVSVAPFDVRLSGFSGGAVNAITRSGTNNWEGSAYYFLRNQGLSGLDPTRTGWNDSLNATQSTREFYEATYGDSARATYRRDNRLADFTAQTYGFRIGGPIIKNKLFFFANAEFQRDIIPEPFNFDNYNGDASLDDLIRLENTLKDTYNYDPGTFTENQTTLDRNFFLLKLDWNINDNHKLALRHLINDVENLEARNSSPNGIDFINGSEFFPSLTNNTTLELNSVIGSNMSNKFQFGMKFVRDDRDVFTTDGAGEFPWVFIDDGAGSIEFGGERFSTANRLDQDVFTLSDNFQIFKGKHNITIGTQNEFYTVGNLFIRENFGAYRYFGTTEEVIDPTTGDTTIVDVSALDQFLRGLPSSQFDRSYSQVDNVAGDESQAIASFSGFQLGFYVQDEWEVTNDFKLTVGLRLDIPVFPTTVPTNAEFNDSTIALIQAAWGETLGTDDVLQGARTGQFINPQFQFAPRLGFNWDVNGQQQTQVRGGVGIFNSRQPLVWFGGAYNNYGFNIAGTRLRNEVVFNPDVQAQVPGEIDVNNPTPGGQIDLFAGDFKLPQVLKADLAVDQKLPGGLIGTAEVLFTKTLNNIWYQSLNIKPSTSNLEGSGDDRPLYNVFDPVDDTYTGIYLGQNTNRGYAYNLAFSLVKPAVKGFGGRVSYSYGDAFSINDGTSSQNNSQWRNYQNVEGRNFLRDVARSSFAPGHRVFASATYRKDYGSTKFGATAITLTYDGASGGLFTYTIDDNGFGGMVNDGAFNDENQFYVPLNEGDINLIDINGGATAAEQWTILNDYIENDPHLSTKRGDYADINSSRTPFTHVWDVKIIQEFYVNTNGKRHTLQLTADIFNVGNLINKDWGRRYFNGNFGNVTAVRFRGFEQGTTIPQYTVDSRILGGLTPEENREVDTGRLRSSRWQMQFGVRYIFE
ncbi:MAG: TonB-dependent receptor [Bacteroidia bacterium]|nr:TonB-dependent receptor [Bacteroidia bacterium]